MHGPGIGSGSDVPNGGQQDLHVAAACMIIQFLLPEESVIGGAAMAVWGEQRGDVCVCSWEVEGLVWP